MSSSKVTVSVTVAVASPSVIRASPNVAELTVGRRVSTAVPEPTSVTASMVLPATSSAPETSTVTSVSTTSLPPSAVYSIAK